MIQRDGAGGGIRTRTGFPPMVFETILSTSSNTPAESAFYRSVFGTHNAVQEHNIIASGDRDIAGCGLGPVHAEQIQGLGEDAENVSRGIGEHISRVLVALDARWKPSRDRVDMPVAVGMDQTTDQRFGMSGDQHLLPCF